MNATQLLNEALVWENHACLPLRPEDDSFVHELSRYRKVGADVVSLNVTFDAVATDPLLGFRMLGQFRRWVSQHAEDYMLINRVEDIETARRLGKTGIFFDIEGGVAVEPGIELIQSYYDLGVRWMLIAYNEANQLGGGCQDDTDKGLTDFGRQVIDEMQRVGMVLCCTHTGERTALEAIEYSSNPVILSHSNPRAMRNHDRNVSDQLIKAIGATGGVVSLNGIGLFLSEHNNPSVDLFVKHVNHVAELIGPEHVGIGLDYCFDTEELNEYVRNNPDIYPADKGYQQGIAMVEPDQIPEIVEAMMASGWNEKDLRGFLGENNLRVARQVWK